jgi:peptidoglycan/LPS O-acetylase OafA/YrhL
VLLSAVHLLFGHAPLPVIVAGAGVICLPVAAVFHWLIEAPSDQLGRNLARRLRQAAALPSRR